MRFQNRLLPARSGSGIGGLKYLMEEGAYFPEGSYGMLQNMTGPGHATMLTGAYPYLMKIALNEWYDGEKTVYCADDLREDVVTDKGTEKGGSSPRNLEASTVGDELKNAGYPARVISLSTKDRSAIFMGGHRADAAIWFSGDSPQWISSTYYFKNKKLPDWVTKENRWLAEQIKAQPEELVWKVGKGSGLSEAANPTLNAQIKFPRDINEQFPHKVKKTSWVASFLPQGFDRLEHLAETALSRLRLGRNDKATDLLAVSFSSFDLLGHQFGPNSREMEEMTVALDGAISRLLRAVDKEVGLGNVLIALTADHGIVTRPEYLTPTGFAAGRIAPGNLAADIENALGKTFGKGSESWLPQVESMNFYVNRRVLAEKKLELAQVENAIRYELLKLPWVNYVVTSTDYERRILPPGMFAEQLLHSYVRGRSGDVIAIPKPYFFVSTLVVDHMTSYAYDRTVPILFAGKAIKKGVFHTNAHVVDIAPTLSALLRVLPPNAAEGRILSEIVKE